MRDADAYQFGRALLAGQLTEPELQFTLAVSRHETGYGDGWKGAGAGSNNMGAITALPGQPSFRSRDPIPGKPNREQSFRIYASQQAGLLDLVRVLLKPNVRAALPNADAAVAAMKANGYYEAPVSAYQQAVRRNHALLVAGAGVPSALTFGGGDFGTLLLFAALAWSLTR